MGANSGANWYNDALDEVIGLEELSNSAREELAALEEFGL